MAPMGRFYPIVEC